MKPASTAGLGLAILTLLTSAVIAKALGAQTPSPQHFLSEDEIFRNDFPPITTRKSIPGFSDAWDNGGESVYSI